MQQPTNMLFAWTQYHMKILQCLKVEKDELDFGT